MTNLANLELRVALKTVASCGCLTKTPDWKMHDPMCLYRILKEVLEVLNETKINKESGYIWSGNSNRKELYGNMDSGGEE